LTEILSRAQTSGGAEVAAERGAESPETSIFTFDDNLERLRPEFSGLAEKKQWGILVSRAETSIASEGDIEARLWWVRGHLGALTLPVSLLAAPFETVCRQLLDDVRLRTFRPLLKEIGDIMLERLCGVGDRRQEYSVRLVLCQLGVVEPDEKSGESYGKVPPKVPRFELGTRDMVTAETPPAEVTRRERKPLVLATLALLLFLLGAGFFFWRSYLGEPQLLVANEDLLGTDQAPITQQPPVLARHVSSNLGAIYYSIDQGDKGAPAVPGSGMIKTSRTSEKNSGNGTLAPAQADRPPAPEPQGAKEQVRTDGPIEGPEFARGVEPRLVPEARLPEVSLPDLSGSLPASSYPDGSLNIGGEVKSALVATDVYQSPDYSARVIARLAAGDKVSVEGRVGEWFRIRSRRGRAGFVIALDVGEPEDFRR
jgi:hypothetical protein